MIGLMLDSPLLRLSLFAVVFAASLIGVAAAVGAQDDADERTLQSMCRVGLASSADAYVNARRELVGDDRGSAAKWTMLLMECHAQAALYAEASDAEFWEQCGRAYTEFIAADADNPRLPWLQWQLARCELLHAQSDMASYLAAPVNSEPREQALTRIRQLLLELEQLADDLAQRQPLAARGGTQGDMQAPAEQLAALAVDVGLLRCEALLLRLRLYPRGSADRIASATEVDQQASEILQRTEPNWPSRPQLQVAAATARLDLGQGAEAVSALEQLAINANHRQARLRAALTAIEFFAAQSRADASNPAASGERVAGISRGYVLLEYLQATESGPEIDLASLQLKLAEVPRSQGAEQQAAMQELVQAAQQLGLRYGDYWRSRADALMVGAIETSPGPETNTLSADLMLVEVRQLLAAGDMAAAIHKLLALRDHEALAGRGEQAMRSAMQAAALLDRQQDWIAATDVLVPISRQFAQLPAAAEAHRQAIYYLSQSLRTSAVEPTLAARYETLLKDQLSQWPESPVSDEVAQWLSLWMTEAGRHEELAAVWLQRASASVQSPNIERALLDWLGELYYLDSAAQVQQQLAALREAWPTSPAVSMPASAEAVLLIGELTGLTPTDQQLQRGVQALTRLDVGSGEGAWKQLLLAVRWLMSIGEQQSPQAISAELLQWQPDQLPTTVRHGLARVFVAAIDETPLSEHASWAKRVKLDEVWREQLLGSSHPRVQASGYRLLAWSVDASAGLDGLTKLSQQAGRSGGILQLELANALADSGPNRWPQSSDLAKVVVANSSAGSELNWQARWRLVKNQLLQGQVAEAQQMAKLWLATQPSEDGLWKTRFESVLSER